MRSCNSPEGNSISAPVRALTAFNVSRNVAFSASIRSKLSRNSTCSLFCGAGLDSTRNMFCGAGFKRGAGCIAPATQNPSESMLHTAGCELCALMRLEKANSKTAANGPHGFVFQTAVFRAVARHIILVRYTPRNENFVLVLEGISRAKPFPN